MSIPDHTIKPTSTTTPQPTLLHHRRHGYASTKKQFIGNSESVVISMRSEMEKNMNTFTRVWPPK